MSNEVPHTTYRQLHWTPLCDSWYHSSSCLCVPLFEFLIPLIYQVISSYLITSVACKVKA